jgi:hypothetical protein
MRIEAMKRMAWCLSWLVVLCLVPSVPSGAAVVTNVDITGTVNATALTATGTVVGDSSTGTYDADIKYSTTVAMWDLFSLYGTIVSVDRFYSEEINIGFGLGTNFDSLNAGNFTFNRSVNFKGGVVGTATFAGQMTRTGPGTIDLTGNVIASGDWTPFGTIVSTGSYEELFASAGAGQATSYMNIPYLMSTGSTVIAETFTTYAFNPLFVLPAPQLGTRSFGSLNRINDAEFEIDQFYGTVAALPEPSTMIILGLGLSMGAMGRRWRGRTATRAA